MTTTKQQLDEELTSTQRAATILADAMAAAKSATITIREDGSDDDGDCDENDDVDDGGRGRQRANAEEGEDYRSHYYDEPLDDDALRRHDEERLALLKQIDAVRQSRCKVRAARAAVSKKQTAWDARLDAAERKRSEAVETYRGACVRNGRVASDLESARRWNVFNDSFHVWHRGPFGTINGLRLGGTSPSGPPPPPSPLSLGSGSATVALSMSSSDEWGGDGASTPPSSLGIDVASLLFSGGGSFFSIDAGNSVGGSGSGYDSHRVPWPEVNNGLGQVCLLLSSLEQAPGSGIKFRGCVLLPMGSHSKIGEKTSAVEPTWYNLYHNEEGPLPQFFARRNFNVALTMLARCIWDASRAATVRDRTLALPHAIEGKGSGRATATPVTIGGLPIAYDPAQGERWTKVCKYLLTDLKWLVAYAAKHVDR